MMIKKTVLVLLNCFFYRSQLAAWENNTYLNYYARSSSQYVYPKETSVENLDKNFLNCYFKNSFLHTSNYIKCLSGSFCLAHAIFSYSNGKWHLSILKQGCSNVNKRVNLDECASNICAIYEEEKNKFCCCSGSLCNIPVLLSKLPMKNSTIHDVPPSGFVQSTTNNAKESNTISFMLVLSSVMASLFVGAIIIYYWKFSGKQALETKSTEADLQNQQTQRLCDKELSNLDNYIHGYIVHNGSHTTVRLATYKGSTVIVKVYPPRFTVQLENENEIYCLLPRHSNIANLIRTNFVQNGYLLLTYYSYGSLYNYLSTNTLTWNQLFIMLTSISNGLSFLHYESSSDKARPVIVHQDLNSRNILVKDNGECVLADFKFSLRIGVSNHSEKFSLVGSAVYAAPEVLTQSIIPQKWCEAFKKVDIYALALVMWELCKRCPAFYKPEAVIEGCTLPYVVELGIHPCIQKVKNLVCLENKRPKFPSEWKKDDPIIEMVKMIITKCWDQNPSLRLSSSCILSQVKNFQNKKLKECCPSHKLTVIQIIPEVLNEN